MSLPIDDHGFTLFKSLSRVPSLKDGSRINLLVDSRAISITIQHRTHSDFWMVASLKWDVTRYRTWQPHCHVRSAMGDNWTISSTTPRRGHIILFFNHWKWWLPVAMYGFCWRWFEKAFLEVMVLNPCAQSWRHEQKHLTSLNYI